MRNECSERGGEGGGDKHWEVDGELEGVDHRHRIYLCAHGVEGKEKRRDEERSEFGRT